MAVPNREPLLRYIAVQALNDKEMAALLRDAAESSADVLRRMGDSFSRRVRSAQLELAQHQQQLWTTVGHQITVGLGDATGAAADSVSFLSELLLNKAGGSSAYWRSALHTQANEALQNVLSRGANGIPLADSVYQHVHLATGRIDRILNAALANGLSAKEVARQVRSYINPDVAGGVSYAAMRLGRTELNNAFHTTTQLLYQPQPWVTAMKWNLSGSHPEGDICDEYAFDSHFRNGGAGEFLKQEVPSKPHPNCLCFTTPVSVDEREFENALVAGKYDDYLNSMGCSSA